MAWRNLVLPSVSTLFPGFFHFPETKSYSYIGFCIFLRKSNLSHQIFILLIDSFKREENIETNSHQAARSEGSSHLYNKLDK